MFRTADGNSIGYMLCHVDAKSDVFELRRIAIDIKGKGYGREAMEGTMRYAFEVLRMNRFWLDVYPDNTTGIRLYESLGMHRDGMLRQSYKSERGYLDQIVYSMLKGEYFARDAPVSYTHLDVYKRQHIQCASRVLAGKLRRKLYALCFPARKRCGRLPKPHIS